MPYRFSQVGVRARSQARLDDLGSIRAGIIASRCVRGEKHGSKVRAFSLHKRQWACNILTRRRLGDTDDVMGF